MSGEAKAGREIYFALYQALADEATSRTASSGSSTPTSST